MKDSIFTKIIKGEIPCHKVYEDADTFAFLDIHPASEGHTLVVPKKQIEFIWDLDEDDYMKLMKSVQKIGAHLRLATGKPYVSQVVVGIDVPHAHIHLIPFETTEDIKGILGASSDTPPDHQLLACVADKVRLS